MYFLCVDPGETTGFTVWCGTEIVDGGQLPLWEFIDAVDIWLEDPLKGFPMLGLDESVNVEECGAIICEDWSLYPWVLKTGALDFDKCRTARGIGALTLIARRNGILFELQGAKIKEAAVAAGAEELYVTPRNENRHQNDSIQHGVFYLAAHDNKPPC